MALYKYWQFPLLLAFIAIIGYFSGPFERHVPMKVAEKELPVQSSSFKIDSIPLLQPAEGKDLSKKKLAKDLPAEIEQAFEIQEIALLDPSDELPFCKERTFLKRLKESRQKRLKFEENAP
ncbi:hypothetical protein [Parachlamydia sp. AcF125]|uniref:hypothetical protein n=1 Tax=Parachlamydia sp. AcF125 TaxID=2795736 RepID=UPI001BC96431|nr:hypothetical protein [Parachlamydia sp. AcF125]MBS4167645.1 hypothetical protein [Parachlamydia sp. AcF125]